MVPGIQGVCLRMEHTNLSAIAQAEQHERKHVYLFAVSEGRNFFLELAPFKEQKII